jgi:CDP-diglyceride synthetase
MYTEGIAILTVILFVAIWVAGVVTWGFGAVYMYKTLKNIHPQRTWGKFLPFSLFMPWFFTEEGNKYRYKLLRTSVIFILLVVSGFGVGFINESLKPQQDLSERILKEGNMASNPTLKRDAQIQRAP